MKLPPLAVPELVETLVGLERSGKGPVVTLMLGNGSALQGVVAGFERGSAYSAVTVNGLTGNGRRSSDLTYLSLGSIVAVTVHDAENAAYVEALGKGKIDLLEGQTPPGKLELSRRAAELGGRLAEKIGGPLAIEVDSAVLAEPRRMLGAMELLGFFEKAVEDLCAHADGRDALKSKVQAVRIVHGSSAAAQVAAGVLTLASPLDAAPPERFRLPLLEKELNRVL